MTITTTKPRVTSFAPQFLVDDLARSMRPIFDALWQSSGWERSLGYLIIDHYAAVILQRAILR